MPMKFSIIIPTHNAVEYLKRALDSVKIQTYTDYELIVVCDACTDNSAEVARGYGAIVYEVNNSNEGPTRNYALDRAQGEWILFIDDDDYWIHPYVLEMLAGRLSNEDLLRFSFIWKGKGYTQCGDWFACWNKCWRRSFIGDTRFGTTFPADEPFHRAMMAKRPVITDWDTPMYYYDYLRPGSQWGNVKGVPHE